jgi:hypothetical protein
MVAWVVALAVVAITGCGRQCTLEALQKGLTVLIRPLEEDQPLPEGSYVVEALNGEEHSLTCEVPDTPPCDDIAVGDDTMLVLSETPDGLSLLWVESRGDVVGGPIQATIRVSLDGELLVEEQLEPEYQRDVNAAGPECGVGEYALVELLF